MRYPHLLKHERKIWSRYLDKYPLRADWVKYDVHVGGIRDDNGVLVPSTVEMWGHLVKKRIDVVVSQRGEICLFEVKRNASHHAIGQLLCYNVLYCRQFDYHGLVRMCLVTDYALPDIDLLCRSFNIDLIEV